MSNIIIIGSGISSLTAAYQLAKAGHEISLYEKNPVLGGHTATIDVTTSSGKYAIDTGFIVFNDWTYPNFIQLMTEVGVKWQDSLMSFSVKSERTGLEYNGDGFSRLFAQKSNALNFRFLRMLFEILKFNKESVDILATDSEITLGDYLRKFGYSDYFSENYILAMGAAIWSSSYAQMLQFPMKFFVQFFKNHGMLSVDNRPVWKVIKGGSRSYIAPLTERFKDRIFVDSPITGISRQSDGVTIEVGGKNPRSVKADYVVIGSHSDQALKLLTDASLVERDVLSHFRYQPNETVLHTDPAILPKREKTWAAWNYFLPRAAVEKVAVTYHMNILQGIRSPENFLVSLNSANQIDPKKVLKTFIYDHPVFDAAAVRAQARWAEVSTLKTRTLFCGAYWGYGFHEDGVKSGLKAANLFESGK